MLTYIVINMILPWILIIYNNMKHSDEIYEYCLQLGRYLKCNKNISPVCCYSTYKSNDTWIIKHTGT